MKSETVLLLRKLTREAVVFALLGQLLATAGIFVQFNMEDRAAAKSKALEAFGGCVPALNFEVEGCRCVDPSKPLSPKCTTDQTTIENYWAAYKGSCDLSGCALRSLYVGVLGFPGGLVLWSFYRLVLFAVKG